MGSGLKWNRMKQTSRQNCKRSGYKIEDMNTKIDHYEPY